MRNTYELQKLTNSTYPYIVWSVNFISPTEYLREIEHELGTAGFHGKIIFDLLLANGNNFNRFIEAYFDGCAFDYTSFKIVNTDLDGIKQQSLDFYRSHLDLLESSVLSKPARFLIRKNILW